MKGRNRGKRKKKGRVIHNRLSWKLLGDLTAALEIRRVERSTAVEPLKIRDAVVKPLVSRVG